MTQTYSSPPNITGHLLRRLTRQRSRATLLDEGRLDVTLAELAAQHADALMEFELLGGRLGRLLTQAGVVVYASLGEESGVDALEALLAQADDSRQRLFPLDPLALTLACAAVDGVPVTVPAFGPSDDLASHLSRQRQTGFSGVVAAERGLDLLIWHFQAGQVHDGPLEVPDVGPERVTQVAWTPRLLPTLDASAPRTAPLSRPVPPAPGRPPAPVPAASRPAPPVQASAAPDVWAVFSKVMAAHLGARAGRVVTLMRQDHGGLQGEALNAQLLKQIERVGGKGAVQEFRQKMNL